MKRIITILLMLGITFLLLSIVLKKRDARDSEFVAILKSYQNAQNVYYSSYRSYAVPQDSLGYVNNDVRFDFVFSEKEIPPSLRTRISERYVPFIKSDAYRILMIIKADPNLVWIIEQSGEPYKVSF